ncbi:MAG: hypothetical protein ACI8UO_003346 [Verrucomicrobiales bacterium]
MSERVPFLKLNATRRVVLVGCGCLVPTLLFVSVFFWPIYRIRVIQHQFDSISKGATREEVVKIMGEPKRKTSDGPWDGFDMWWGENNRNLKDDPKLVVELFHYSQQRPFYLHILWEIGFDARGRTRHKMRHD